MQTAEFVWISLPPESVPTGDHAVLRVVRTGSSAAVPVVEGGFDPVALAAHEGDSIVVTIIIDGVEKPTGFSFVVPPPSRPVIVRTSPPKGKRDVPLNARVTVVFSEPIDVSSLTTVSVQVRSGSAAVEGQLHFTDNTHLVAEFVPAQPLAGSTDYELRIAETIRDLDGMTLGAAVSVPFTTGVAPDSEAVASVRVTPTAGTVEQGAVLMLAAEVTGTEGTLLARPVTWASGDSTVATVSPSGGVFGVRAGSTTISATSEGIVGTATVTVTPYTGGVGPKIAFVRDGQIHVVNPDGSGLVRLTDGHNDADPAWSPDGKRIAFSRQRPQPPGILMWDIFIMNADGSNVVQRTNDSWSEMPAWSPDGSRIAFLSNRNPHYGNFLVYVMSAADDGAAPRLVSFTSGLSTQPAWSPDGTRIAFVSDWRFYDFTFDVFLANPDAPGIVQKTNGFGFDGIVEEEGNRITIMEFWQPAWSPDGRTMAVVACPIQWSYCESSSGLWLIDASDASSVSNRGDVLAMLTPTTGFAGPTWSPDGTLIAYASGGSLYWIRKDGTAQGLIIANGHSPSWRR